MLKVGDELVDLDEYMRLVNLGTISQWYPKIKDCGIPSPRTQIVQVPSAVVEELRYYEDDGDSTLTEKFIESEVKKHIGNGEKFIRTGCYSHKFDARYCFTDSERLLRSFITINIEGMNCGFLGAGGEYELAIRDIIPWNEMVTPTIYHGLPFRLEIRAFYDFDERRLLYCTNYWYDSEKPDSMDMTSKIVHTHMEQEMRKQYAESIEEVSKLVEESMKDVDMSGRWSIDLLCADKIYLIDMAVAELSDMWNPERARK